jgi:hypothetical protein
MDKQGINLEDAPAHCGAPSTGRCRSWERITAAGIGAPGILPGQ